VVGAVVKKSNPFLIPASPRPEPNPDLPPPRGGIQYGRHMVTQTFGKKDQQLWVWRDGAYRKIDTPK
jgi:hypothetical protein